MRTSRVDGRGPLLDLPGFAAGEKAGPRKRLETAPRGRQNDNRPLRWVLRGTNEKGSDPLRKGVRPLFVRASHATDTGMLSWDGTRSARRHQSGPPPRPPGAPDPHRSRLRPRPRPTDPL